MSVSNIDSNGIRLRINQTVDYHLTPHTTSDKDPTNPLGCLVRGVLTNSLWQKYLSNLNIL